MDFHAAHYCAANACFATYGKLDVEALHVRFEPYLRHRPGRRIDPPALQPQLPAPQTVTVPVPLEAGQDLRDVSQARLTWVWATASTWARASWASWWTCCCWGMPVRPCA